MTVRLTATGVLSGTSVLCVFKPQSRPLKLVALVLQGPLTPALNVWSPTVGDGASLISTTPNGDVNHAEFVYPATIQRGDSLTIEWTEQAALTAAYVTATFEEV